ncbi:T9SS type A sorting domain-containing protein [candidate division WOR-3 bacterium]|nr:T9SS type A sorting domain-containing protein [candidate division WOR-3 bacterium]
MIPVVRFLACTGIYRGITNLKKLPVIPILSMCLAGITSGADIEASFMHDGRIRSYILHVPPSYTGDDSIPLVINLHGGGGSASQQASFSLMNPKADAEGFLVCYPEGTFLPLGFTGWNAGEIYKSTVDDVGFIDALIDTVRAGYNVDTLRIHAAGFSNGASMCYRLACELGSRIAAIGPVAGPLYFDDWNDCEPERLMPTIHFHSRHDPNGSYSVMDSMMDFWSSRMGCDIGPDTFYNDSGALKQHWMRADDSCEIIFWTVERYQHGWPGSPLGTKEVITNDEMWSFFVAHPLPVQEEEPGITEQYRLPQDFSFTAKTNFSADRISVILSLDFNQEVSLKLYDASGRLKTRISERELTAGLHQIDIDIRKLPSGVYFLKVITPAVTGTQHITVLK